MKLTTFKCDECGKVSEAKEESELFEEDKWIRVSDLKIAVRHYGSTFISGEHYCSIPCLIDTITKLIEKERKLED